jgi:hypothetical protein
MRIKAIFLTICVALLSLSANAKIKDGKAMTGSSLTDFGKYTVMKSNNPMVVNGEELKTYDLMYENTSNAVRVGVLKEKKCKSFIVKSDVFEVQYVCKNGVFGVKKIESRFQDLPKEANEAKLDKVGYYSQRVICQNKKTEDELLGLIACYFPNLVKEDYQAGF